MSKITKEFLKVVEMVHKKYDIDYKKAEEEIEYDYQCSQQEDL